MNGLLIEIVVSLIASSVFGMVIGWLLKGSAVKRQQKLVDARWQQQLAELELRTRQDTDHLEARVQTLGRETIDLRAANRALEDALHRLGADDPERFSAGRVTAFGSTHRAIPGVGLSGGTSRTTARRGDEAMPWLYPLRHNTKPAGVPIARHRQHRHEVLSPEFDSEFAVGREGEAQDTLVIDPDELQIAALDDTMRLQDHSSARAKAFNADESTCKPDRHPRAADASVRTRAAPAATPRAESTGAFDRMLEGSVDDNTVLDADAVLVTEGDDIDKDRPDPPRPLRFPRAPRS